MVPVTLTLAVNLLVTFPTLRLPAILIKLLSLGVV
jgi:hypothetical protein